MKICRFHPKESVQRSESPNEGARYGIIQNGQVSEIESPFESQGMPLGARSGTSRAFTDVHLLAPSEPSKIVCIGRNYAEHAAELGNTLPTEPLIFLKPPSAIVAPEQAIVLTPHSDRVDFEGELAIVIQKLCRNLKTSDRIDPYILGYTCLNDVTARDLQKKDVQFTRAKGFDTFCPFGPWIETELDLNQARLETFVNKKRRQSAAVTEMVFPVDVIVRWISQVMTLMPGDVIATGTPSGIGPLVNGDIVEVVVSSIGTLLNPVVAPR